MKHTKKRSSENESGEKFVTLDMDQPEVFMLLSNLPDYLPLMFTYERFPIAVDYQEWRDLSIRFCSAVMWPSSATTYDALSEAIYCIGAHSKELCSHFAGHRPIPRFKQAQTLFKILSPKH